MNLLENEANKTKVKRSKSSFGSEGKIRLSDKDKNIKKLVREK